MREIKFRGLVELEHSGMDNTTSNEWVYGSLIVEPTRTLMQWVDGRHVVRLELVSTHTVGQFTGLKDKNGVEIYEGDVVAIAFWNGVDMADIENGVIKWHEESSAFKWFSGEPSDANNYWLSHADTKHREVIGNIYENPELLTRKDT